MDALKEIRWKQRFTNFEKSNALLKQYIHQPLETELEEAGIIHFFEISFELALKVMKDYLEAQGFYVKSPRETIKQAYQMGLIEEAHDWMDALADRNVTVHTYDEKLAKKMIHDIVNRYFPALEKLNAKWLEVL